MNPKVLLGLKIGAALVVSGCAVVLLSANKMASGVTLIVASIVIVLPINDTTWLKWARVVFMLCAATFVIWNISTTEYRPKCYNTGVRFFDQVLRIYDGFLQNTFNTSISDSQCRIIPDRRPE